MDANGTRFHLLLGRDDWGRCASGDTPLRTLWDGSPPGAPETELYWDTERAELTLRPHLVRSTRVQPRTTLLTPADRSGSARDRYGNWYWIEPGGEKVRVRSQGSQEITVFWPLAQGSSEPAGFGGFAPEVPRSPAQATRFGGLTVTEEHFLIVGTLDPAGVLVFDLHAGGPPREVRWPSHVPFTPYDMTAMPGGGVTILDREQGRLWLLDRLFQVRCLAPIPEPPLPPADTFQPLAGGPVRRGGAAPAAPGIDLAHSVLLRDIDALAVESLQDGTTLVLGRAQHFSRLYRFRDAAQLGAPVALDLRDTVPDIEAYAAMSVIHDIAVVPAHDEEEGRIPERLYAVTAGGHQGFAFSLDRQAEQIVLTGLPLYLPMRMSEGKAVVAADGQAYYDAGGIWAPLIAQRRVRFQPEASFVSEAFEGIELGCVWHRLLLDACVPADTTIQVWSRAGDSPEAVAQALWSPEPPPRRRPDGSELPFLPGGADGTHELLFQRAQGRYLQVRVSLHSDGPTAPRLRAMRVYFPRFSYVQQYLPAVYQEEPGPASFLERFLANLEGFYTAIEDRIAAVQVLLDPRSAPPDWLDWLAGWFGVALDPAWDDARRRLFVRHAMDFFNCRGTARGLRMALRLLTEHCPSDDIFSEEGDRRLLGVRIIEHFRSRGSSAVALGDPTDLSGIREVSAAQRWEPAHGRAALQLRYAAARGDDPIPEEGTLFPLRAPAGAEGALWRRFSQDVMGFVPATTAADLVRWQAFLARRYQRAEALNRAHRTGYRAFSDVPLPEHLPDDGPPLIDWYQFERVVQASRQAAHRFTVLVPLPDGSTDDGEALLRLAQRVVTLEKPAHTIFDVRFYWAMFRVGVALLGEDTVLGQGSRVSQLTRSTVLGQGRLAESFLAPRHPQGVAERRILGRDQLGG